MAGKIDWLNISLWISQVLLGLFFIMNGSLKVYYPYEQLIATIPWGSAVSAQMFIFIGVMETLGGIGVILPALLKKFTILTPLAGLGLFAVMVLAAGFHAIRNEYVYILFNIPLGALGAFIAYGRYKLRPINSN